MIAGFDGRSVFAFDGDPKEVVAFTFGEPEDDLDGGFLPVERCPSFFQPIIEHPHPVVHFGFVTGFDAPSVQGHR
jgi:hypothetical protein